MNEFPMPFGGIQIIVDLNPWELHVALSYLTAPAPLGCGHVHNFAVEMDHYIALNHRPRIYTTPLGAECIARVVNA